MPPYGKGFSTLLRSSRSSLSDKNSTSTTTLSSSDNNGIDELEPDVESQIEQQSEESKDTSPYFSGRQMTNTQEMLNAFTMIPGLLACIYTIHTGSWISEESMNIAHANPSCQNSNMEDSDIIRMIKLLPYPVLAIAIGVCVHFPFSFYYHWLCARHLPPGYQRISHLSRRLDSAAIHFSSAMFSLSTSGNWIYFSLCALYNADSAFKHFQKKVQPQRNHRRLALAIILYIAPCVFIKNQPLSFFIDAFGKMISLLVIGIWFFVAYPIGGYSHSVFHLLSHFPLVGFFFTIASHLDISLNQMGPVACYLVSEGRI